MKTRTYFAHRIDMLDAAGELQEHLAGVEDYILAEAVWREAIARWPGATPMQDDRRAMGAKAKSGYSRYGDIHRRDECAGWEKTMFLLARYTVAAAVFLSASAASAVEDATLSAYRMLPACTAFIADKAPSEIDAVFHAGRCIGLMQGLGYASRLFGVCPPDEVTLAEKARVAVTYVEARPERMSEDFRVLAVEAMQKAWPCK